MRQRKNVELVPVTASSSGHFCEYRPVDLACKPSIHMSKMKVCYYLGGRTVNNDSRRKYGKVQ